MSNLEELLGEELFAEVSEALRGKGKDGKDPELVIANDGSFLPKAKFDALYREYREAKAISQQSQEELGAVSALREENEMLKTTLATVREESEAMMCQLKEEMVGVQRNVDLEQALGLHKVRNTKAVNALLDWDAIGYGEGGFEGLDEQIALVKEASPYLFDEVGSGGLYEPKGGRRTPDFSAMSDAEYYRLRNKKG